MELPPVRVCDPCHTEWKETLASCEQVFSRDFTQTERHPRWMSLALGATTVEACIGSTTAMVSAVGPRHEQHCIGMCWLKLTTHIIGDLAVASHYSFQGSSPKMMLYREYAVWAVRFSICRVQGSRRAEQQAKIETISLMEARLTISLMLQAGNSGPKRP